MLLASEIKRQRVTWCPSRVGSRTGTWPFRPSLFVPSDSDKIPLGHVRRIWCHLSTASLLFGFPFSRDGHFFPPSCLHVVHTEARCSFRFPPLTHEEVPEGRNKGASKKTFPWASVICKRHASHAVRLPPFVESPSHLPLRPLVFVETHLTRERIRNEDCWDRAMQEARKQGENYIIE